MKVKELIEKLKEHYPELPVCVYDSEYDRYNELGKVSIVEDASFIPISEESSTHPKVKKAFVLLGR